MSDNNSGSSSGGGGFEPLVIPSYNDWVEWGKRFGYFERLNQTEMYQQQLQNLQQMLYQSEVARTLSHALVGTTKPASDPRLRSSAAVAAPISTALPFGASSSAVAAPISAVHHFGASSSAVAVPISTALPFGASSSAAPISTALPFGASSSAAPISTALRYGASSSAAPISTALPFSASSSAAPISAALPFGASSSAAPISAAHHFGASSSAVAAPISTALRYGASSSALPFGSVPSFRPAELPSNTMRQTEIPNHKTCLEFLAKGKCEYAGCKWSTVIPLQFKTEQCPEHQKGTCSHRDPIRCRYAHGPGDVFCINWNATGTCTREDCPYIHFGQQPRDYNRPGIKRPRN